ncbi:MAG: flagellar hook capping FlgD N-terminal domain-containing protein [Phycisphaerales bacterium]|nr:flagellar hook capping FlgD N-terminal domain-containing protein [Phycisphaerales bacterium]|tara:strand:+ start:13953 stop:14510 length:558 start_codon:yes stop_codon:yes gene_type:complete
MSQINAPDLFGSVDRTTTSGFASMSSEDFIKIMFTELTNQDPLAPTDSAALLEQMNSIRSIESDMQMVDNMQSLVFENQLASASSLIGKFVGGLDWSGVRIGGVVSAVIRQGDEIALELDSGAFLPVSGVETIITQDVLDSIGSDSSAEENDSDEESDPAGDSDDGAENGEDDSGNDDDENGQGL